MSSKARKYAFGLLGVLFCGMAIWALIGYVYLRNQWMPELIDQAITNRSQVWPVPSGLVRMYLIKSEGATDRARNSKDPLVAMAVASLPPRPLSEREFNHVKPILVWILHASKSIEARLPNGETSPKGMTALNIAAFFGQSRVVQLLLRGGADATVKSLSQWFDPKTRLRMSWSSLDFAMCGLIKNKDNKSYEIAYKNTVKEIKNALGKSNITINEEMLQKEVKICGKKNEG